MFLGDETLKIQMFLFESHLLETTLCAGLVLVVWLYWLNVTIMMDFCRASWNFFTSVVPGHDKTLLTLILTITLLICWMFSSTLWHWLDFTIVTDVFTSGWNVLESVIPALGLVETSTVLVFGSYSSTLLVFLVVIVSIRFLNFSVVTDSFRSGWKRLKSRSSGENLPQSSGETTLVRTLLVVMVSVLLWHWLDFTIVTDVFTSGWNVLESIIPGLGLVETTTVLVFGSYSSTLLVFSVLLVSVHLLNMMIVTDSFRSGWNRFISVLPGSDGVKTLGTLTITILGVGSVSPSFMVVGVLMLSVHFVNVTMVTNVVRSVFHVYVSEGDETKLLAKAVREKSSLLPPQTGSVPVYKIPLREKLISISGCRYFSFGKKSSKPNRTIVVVGAADSGKSAVISGMMNHILGVEWADSYRFKVVQEVQSVHGEVTVYKIYHQKGFRIDYSLTIVDTPGFGDSRGVDQGREISEQLRNVFYSLHDVGEIHSVCFVAPAALTQLTTTQKSVFDSVLSIFGKDVEENIRILVTSADDQLPPVLEAIKASGVPCPRAEDGLPVHFSFNNSALFADSSRTDGHQVLWTMGTNSMMRLFAALQHMNTIRLTLTSEALGDRKQVESSVENLQKQVKLGLAKLEKIRETIEKLKDHEAEISRDENFEFYVVVKKPVKVDIKHALHYITNCQQCQVTCYSLCNLPNNDKKRECSIIDNNGYCTVCPGKCFWNVHFNQKFKWEYQEFKEKQTVKELKENYEEAVEQKVSSQGLIQELKAEYEDVQKEVMKVIQVCAKCLNRLKEIGHASHSLSTLEYIDMLIGGETTEAKAGWERRVERLMEVREKVENNGEGPQ